MLKKEMVEMIVTNGWATEAELKGLKKDELINVIESAKRKPYPINPLDDPEVQAMDVSDEALLPITAEQKLIAMNPGFSLTEKEIIVPVGDLEITSDKIVEEKEEKIMETTTSRTMEDKEFNKQVCIGAVVYLWIKRTSSKYCEEEKKLPLFYDGKVKKYRGNKLSSRHYVFETTCEAVEAVFSCKKLGTKRFLKVRDWLIEAGYCHLCNGVDIHMSSEEWNKSVELYTRIITKSKESGCKTVVEYIKSKKR